MKKTLLTLAITAGTAWSAFAQKSTAISTDTVSSSPANGPHFNFGLDGGITLPGDSRAIVGASFKYELPFTSHTLFTASVGYSYLFYTKETKKALDFYGINQNGVSFLPVKIGVKHYLGNQFFVEGQVGAAVLLSRRDIYNRYTSAYAYAAGFGYTLKKGLELGIRYEDWRKDFKISQAAARLSYRFK